MKRKKWIRGAAFGGAIVFLWGMLSWMLIPWHTLVFKTFANEEAVAETIQTNASVSGIYVLPNTFSYTSSTTSEQMENGLRMLQTGPTVFASVRLEGMGRIHVRPFIVALLFEILGAGIITWMLLQTKGLGFCQRLFFVTLFGVAIGILGVLPAWNWWGFSLNWIFFLLSNLIVGWFLAGLAIAKICK
jgi:hypothetical protein